MLGPLLRVTKYGQHRRRTVRQRECCNAEITAGISAVRRARRLRHRRPDRVAHFGSPIHADTWLELESGEVVVLDLCSNRQMHALRLQRNFILHESAEELDSPVGGSKRLIDGARDSISTAAISHSPNQIVKRTQ